MTMREGASLATPEQQSNERGVVVVVVVVVVLRACDYVITCSILMKHIFFHPTEKLHVSRVFTCTFLFKNSNQLFN